MSLLPPCQALMRLYALHSNVVARIWEISDERRIQMPDLAQQWVEKAFPDELEMLPLNEEE